MKRPKGEPPVKRRLKLQHILLGMAVLYLVFVLCKFLQFLEIVTSLSRDDVYDEMANEDSDLSKPMFSSVHKDTLDRKLEDDQRQDALVRPSNEPLIEMTNGSKTIMPLRHRYDSITGEIMKWSKRTNELSVFERMADEVWTLGLSAWEELDKLDVKEVRDSSIVQGKPESWGRISKGR